MLLSLGDCFDHAHVEATSNHPLPALPPTTSANDSRDGVVTTTAASKSRTWQRVSWASPVPGGQSTTRTSRSRQATDATICWTTPLTYEIYGIFGRDVGRLLRRALSLPRFQRAITSRGAFEKRRSTVARPPARRPRERKSAAPAPRAAAAHVGGRVVEVAEAHDLEGPVGRLEGLEELAAVGVDLRREAHRRVDGGAAEDVRRGPVDVRVREADPQAARLERERDVGRHRRLADAALAGGHGQDPPHAPERLAAPARRDRRVEAVARERVRRALRRLGLGPPLRLRRLEGRLLGLEAHDDAARRLERPLADERVSTRLDDRLALGDALLSLGPADAPRQVQHDGQRLRRHAHRRHHARRHDVAALQRHAPQSLHQRHLRQELRLRRQRPTPAHAAPIRDARRPQEPMAHRDHRQRPPSGPHLAATLSPDLPSFFTRKPRLEAAAAPPLDDDHGCPASHV